ncbi:Sugar ABC superfamily transporter, permease [Alteracholeplasma palmae J233]|uniref:Sugar ABC superfamily transporter, permease n=1 Tax=Alteracholeplasma palmae (strain ATCC 49389 / J233) TaxID=1318466 RepID=U4KM18_ALTPJ|nr:carbohydrate ABC transporter permease [Alteracholeplasma palmae]CCV64998.1 Sugar ABC superfamily transporter, permease [Alteracholeplasma palmae J233]
MTESQKQLKNQRTANIIQKTLVYTFLGIMALIMIIPFYWMVITALKSATEVELSPPTLFPKELIWQNFSEALEKANLIRYFINTIIVAAVSTVFGTFFAILMAFALSRLQFKGRDLIFTILLATMMIPGEMMVLTNYITVSKLGWVDPGGGARVLGGPYYAMIIPFLVSVANVYLLRNTFRQVPNELYYAAKVDGVGDWKYLWKVMVPMAKSSIITIVILKIMGTWNSYAWPNLVANDNFRLITNGLRSAFTNSDTGNTSFHLQMAATIIVTVPLLILFMVFRKYIMTGVSRSGIKG